MNRIATKIINWESEAVLSQIADQIHKPLAEIIRLTRHIQHRSEQKDIETNRLSAIMLESSEQLESLVADILRMEEQKLIQVIVRNKFKYPELYTLGANTMPTTAKLLANSHPMAQRRIAKADLEWLMQLETKVLENLTTSFLCVPWLAEELAVSERQLFRKIEKYTGLTPNKYIRNLKLHRAKTLLENYAYSTVNEVALAVGLRDPYYFSKLFKEEFGRKPKDYLN